ncbi:MAG: hypothetical protein CVU91_09750 [Firmicutes bacterium HGW-Firmicutes-16]|nr:MAG: hypothetical protein CVU91_09750 [Firmicutes bacterium HGW-Firmicutes-16]
MIKLISAGEFWVQYKPFIIGFAVMVVLAFVLLQFLVYARRQAELELDRLFKSDAELYLERLEHNKRLSFVFRKPIMLLLKLDGYLKTGNDDAIRSLVKELDMMRLEPRDKVEYYQKRMSFFVSVGEADEAKASFEKLQTYLHSVKADEEDRYRTLLEEGQEIIRVYLDKDVSYMDKLKKKAENTEHPVMRGVMYFRLAKLAHFKGDAPQREKYLNTASKPLSGTDYEEIIKQALITPEILETK